MTLQPSYINFTRNVTTTLTGGKIDTSAVELTCSALFFQELQDKARALKHALGLVQELNAETFTLSQIETPISYPLPEGSFSEGVSTAFVDRTMPIYTPDEVKAILQNPNLATSKIFVDDLEKVFENYLKSVTNVDPSDPERTIITKYQSLLRDLKPKFVTGGTPTDSDYAALYALPADFVKEIEALKAPDAPPKNKIHAFWQDIMTIYNNMQVLSYPVADYLNVQVADLVLNITAAQKIQQYLRNFYSILKDILNPGWTDPNLGSYPSGAEYNARDAGVIQSLLNLSGNYRMLTENMLPNTDTSLPQEIINQIINFQNSLGAQVISQSSSGNIRLDTLLGIAYVYQCCANLFGTNYGSKVLSKQDYINTLNQEKSYWTARGHGFDVTSGGVFEGFVNDVNSNTGYKNIKIFQNGQVNQINPTFLSATVALLRNPYSLIGRDAYQGIEDAANRTITALEGLISGWNTQITTFQMQKNAVDPSQLKYFETMKTNKKTFVDTAPLQMVYASLMLDKYLPTQQNVITSLGVQMTYSNKAAKYLNELIKEITAFQTADIYYSLSIYLKQMNLQAIADPIGKAIGALSKEKERATADVARCKKVKAAIDEMLVKIKADADLSKSQIRELVDTLTTFKSQSDDLIRNLSCLLCYLSGITLEAVSNPDDTYEAFTTKAFNEPFANWKRQLATFESFVIQGGQNGITPGGEQQLLQAMESSQQDFSTFNQNQQLALQLESSAMQQEWTLVSAALALLNQLVSKIARRIKS
ncbi:CT620/CT621 family type III secretion system effector [Candidatus Chlamydia corallus]|uniref:CT620/CT621 family type III secretion system effector n=1 Tax=Candidatus Chlamydia corallus TaxID=2038470 RepID=UPI000C2FED02|nr:CT620/CT621 family type III secretion system effector [Candidatus Chlamydia corallus]